MTIRRGNRTDSGNDKWRPDPRLTSDMLKSVLESIRYEMRHDVDKFELLFRGSTVLERSKRGLTLSRLSQKGRRTIEDRVSIDLEGRYHGQNLEIGEGCQVTLSCETCTPAGEREDWVFSVDRLKIKENRVRLRISSPRQRRGFTFCQKSHRGKGSTTSYRVDLHSSPEVFNRQLRCVENIMTEFCSGGGRPEGIERAPQTDLPRSILSILVDGRDRQVHKSQRPLAVTKSRMYDDSQREVVKRALAADRVFLIHGPPGTGKTTVLEYVILETLKENPDARVLVTADSNKAVDNIVMRLQESGICTTRIGVQGKIDMKCRGSSLTERFFSHPWHKEFASIQEQLSEVGRELRKLPRTSALRWEEYKQPIWGIRHSRSYEDSGRDGEKQRMLATLRRERRGLQSRLSKTYERINASIMKGTEVLACTTAYLEHPAARTFLRYASGSVDLAVFDEATQASSGSAWLPIIMARKIILAGDHKQLPPVVLTPEAFERGYGISLFERMLESITTSDERLFLGRLTIQYRMNPVIMGFSNIRFYGGRIKPGKGVDKLIMKPELADRSLDEPDEWRTLLDGDNPLVLLDTSTSDTSRERRVGTSYTNPLEVDISEAIVKKLHTYRIRPDRIGVITPYLANQRQLRARLEKLYPIEVSSVDGFQGREKDVIVLSLTRDNPNERIGFLHDERRLNVALTRARRKLIIVANAQTFSRHAVYRDLFRYIRQNGTVCDIPNLAFDWQAGTLDDMDIFCVPARRFPCPLCDDCFTSVVDLQDHIEARHEASTKMRECRFCGKLVSGPVAYHIHLMEDHADRRLSIALRAESVYRREYGYSAMSGNREKMKSINAIIADGLGRDFFRFLEWRLVMYRGRIETGARYERSFRATQEDIQYVSQRLSEGKSRLGI